MQAGERGKKWEPAAGLKKLCERRLSSTVVGWPEVCDPPTPIPRPRFHPREEKRRAKRWRRGTSEPFLFFITSIHKNHHIPSSQQLHRGILCPITGGAGPIGCRGLALLSSKTRDPFYRNPQPTPNHSSRPSLCFAIPSVLSGSHPRCACTTPASAGTALRWKWVSPELSLCLVRLQRTVKRCEGQSESR